MPAAHRRRLQGGELVEVQRQSIDSAAHQPPFRRRKRRRGLAAKGAK